MALIKIYTKTDNFDQTRKKVAKAIKIISAGTLNCSEVPTSIDSIETVLVEGLDLIGIDYIVEIIACKRPNMQKIAEDTIVGLNTIYPDLLFSVYFNLISENGMANTPRLKTNNDYLTIQQAIELASQYK